jgi:transcriptional regulator with XRE-family HTH domain
MRTTQSAVSRVESGRTLPSLAFIERYARAAGRPITFTIGGDPIEPSRKELRRRVRAAIGDFTFDPWRRDPSPAEARTLVADGLTREHFQSAATP